MSVSFWNCSYVPWEISLACGFQPRRFWAERQPIPRADRYLPANLCSYARTIFEQAVACPQQDVFILADCCDATRRLADALEMVVPGRTFLLFLPHSATDAAVFARELMRLAKFLHRGNECSRMELEAAIRQCNELRLNWRRIEIHARARKLVPLEYYHALQAYNTMSIAEIEAILDHADRDQGSSDGSPVFLFGNTLDDGEIWQMLAELSFTVVGEDFCYGQKQAKTLVAETDGDPFLRIAHAYLARTPCPRTAELERRWQEITNRVKECKVRGAIFLPTKYCDHYLYDLPILAARLKSAGNACLILEQDYTQKPSGQLRTRLEAFRETL